MTSTMVAKQCDRRDFVRFMAGGVLLTLAGGTGALTGCTSFGEAVSGEREFTDDMGRTLKIPTAGNIQRVYFTSGLAEIFCFTLNPDVLAGTAIQFTPEDKEYLPARMGELMYMGSLSEDGEINRELLMAEKVQVVFSISAVGLTQANLADAEKLQNATNIPVILLDGSLYQIADCYRKLGDILGTRSRAEELGAYCERIFDEVEGIVSTIPEDQRVPFYYAEGPQGTQTEPATSQHAEIFNLAGGYNVAQVPEGAAYGMSNVSLEDIIKWNPPNIFAWSWDQQGGADNYIRSNASWKLIKAVQDDRVFTLPSIPFTWVDRPPGVNRILGLQYLLKVFFPDRFQVDVVERAQEFYRLFYGVEVDTETMKGFFGSNYPF